MDLAQHNKTCRLCLSTTNIVTPKIEGALVKKIYQCTGILVDSKSRDMPRALCEKCDKKLGIWSEFREHCTTINNMLYDKNDGMDEIEVDINEDVDVGGGQEYPMGEETIEIDDTEDDQSEPEEKYNVTDRNKNKGKHHEYYDEHLKPKLEPIAKFETIFNDFKVEPLHECDICNRKFMTERVLKDHRFDIHGIKKHACSLCTYATNRSSDFLRHKRRVHKITDLLYKCELCYKSYFDPSNLSAHLRSHSKDTTHCKVS